MSVPSLGLTHVEDGALSKLQHLQILDLSTNPMTTLPALPPTLLHLEAHSCMLTSVSSLVGTTSLQTLTLSVNPLEAAEVSFQGLVNLESVSMFNCGLSRAPSHLSDCRSLRTLHLSDNPFGSQFPSLSGLVSLVDLDLRNCGLVDIPSHLSSSQNLTTFGLQQNNMTHLPDELCELSRLQYLYLDETSLIELPSCLGNIPLKMLTLLDMPRLESLPPSWSQTQIVSLHLRGSPIKQLPSSLQHAPMLQEINLEDMPLLDDIDPVIFNARSFLSFELVGAPSLKTVPDLSKVTNPIFTRFKLKGTSIKEWHIQPGTFPKLSLFEISDSLLSNITRNLDVGTEPLVESDFPTKVVLSRNRIKHFPPLFEYTFGAYISILDISHNPLTPGHTISFQNCHLLDSSFTSATSINTRSRSLNVSFTTGELQALQIVGGVVSPSSLDFEGYVDLRGSHINHLIRNSHIVTLDTNSSQAFLEEQVVCREWQTRLGVQTKVMFTPDQVDYLGCLCLRPKEMIFQRDIGECVPRGDLFPQGLSLSYGKGLLDAIYSVDPGFYPISSTLGLCNTSSPDFSPYSSCKIAKCVTPPLCNPTGGDRFSCANGFDPESLLCSECPPGSYESVGYCHSCPSYPYIGIVFNILGVLAVVTVYLRSSFTRDLRHQRAYSSVSIFLAYIQVTSVAVSFVNRINVKGGGSSDASFIWFVVSELLGNFNPFILPCVDPNYFSTSVWLLLSLPLLVVLSAVCVCYIVSHFRNLDHKLYNSAALYATTFILQLLYIPLCRTTFQLFSCESDPLFGSYLRSAPYISCSDTKYFTMRAAAIASVFLYIIGIPALMGYIVYIGRPKLSQGTDMEAEGSSDASSAPSGFDPDHSLLPSPPVPVASKSVWHSTTVFLCGVHKENRSYWTVCIVNLRKCLVVLPISLFPPHSSFIPLATLLVLQVALILHLFYRPYCYNFDNALESFLLLLSITTFLTGVTSTSDVFESSNDTYDFLLGFNVFVVAAFVVCLPVLRRYRKRKGTKEHHEVLAQSSSVHLRQRLLS